MFVCVFGCYRVFVVCFVECFCLSRVCVIVGASSDCSSGSRRTGRASVFRVTHNHNKHTFADSNPPTSDHLTEGNRNEDKDLRSRVVGVIACVCLSVFGCCSVYRFLLCCNWLHC